MNVEPQTKPRLQRIIPSSARAKAKAVPFRSRGGASRTSLDRYMKELAAHDTFDAEHEAEAAKQIAELEQELWQAVLGDRATVCETLDELRIALAPQLAAGEPEQLGKLITSLSRRAKLDGRSDAARRAYGRIARELSACLWEIDARRALVALARDRVLDRGTKRRSSGRRRKSPDAQRVDRAARAVAEAKHRFIGANLRLVAAAARRFDTGQLPLIDLIQEGNLGLLTAVDRFDYRRGYRFSTYALWWIRSTIRRALADKARTVRIPVHVLEKQRQLDRASRTISGRLGRAPTEDELLDQSGLDKRELALALEHPVRPMVSLDNSISESDERRYVDMLVDESEKSPPEAAALNSWTAGMQDALSILSPRERQIIRWRFGLYGAEERTLREIGDCLNLSRERIRQLQQRALIKLRKYLELDAA